MNEHKTASFVAKMAWVTLMLMQLALFAGLPYQRQSVWPLVVVGAIAIAASATCTDAKPPVKTTGGTPK